VFAIETYSHILTTLPNTGAIEMPPTTPPPDLPPTPSTLARLEPIIGGTLALLTHYARTPNLAAADRIAGNLALIARHPDASAALQTVCTRLFSAWLGPLELQDAVPGSEWRDVWPMPPLPQ
jgi:hypothetical protein